MQLPPELPTYNPYAAPVSRLEDFPGQILQLASRWSRLGAYILDILSFALLGIVAAVVLPSLGKSGARELPDIFFAIIGMSILAIIAVHTTFLYKYGQTIGKRLVGIKVVQSNGMRCELWRYIFMRTLPIGILSNIPFFGAILSLVDTLMIFGQDQRCLHDLIANTIVVQA